MYFMNNISYPGYKYYWGLSLLLDNQIMSLEKMCYKYFNIRLTMEVHANFACESCFK